MKRLILLAVLTTVLVGTLSFVNCSNPLEADGGPNPNPPIYIYDTVFEHDTIIGTDTMYVTDTIIGTDTLIVTDTLINEDTVFVTDTLIQEDTIIVTDTLIEEDTVIITDTLINTDTLTITDTLTQIDTVIIYEPGPGGWSTICSILLANLREIIWMFDNQEGTYDFHFTATVSRDFSSRILIVEIDDHPPYEWNPSTNPEFNVDGLFVNADATIRVRPDQPLLLGHQVDICLTISKRQ